MHRHPHPPPPPPTQANTPCRVKFCAKQPKHCLWNNTFEIIERVIRSLCFRVARHRHSRPPRRTHKSMQINTTQTSVRLQGFGCGSYMILYCAYVFVWVFCRERRLTAISCGTRHKTSADTRAKQRAAIRLTVNYGAARHSRYVEAVLGRQSSSRRPPTLLSCDLLLLHAPSSSSAVRNKWAQTQRRVLARVRSLSLSLTSAN